MTNNIKFEIGLNEALNLTFKNLDQLDPESVDLTEALGRVPCSDIYSLVDSPSVAASLKDGYAVLASDISHASVSEPVKLKLAGYRAAGSMEKVQVTPGHAVRVMTGAAVPPGADAVVSEEFTKDEGENISVFNYAQKGRNILDRGTDVFIGQCVAKKGIPLSPGDVGQIAAGGHGKVSVVRNPVVAVISTGDEVLAPGHPMSEGKVYASNMATLVAWCHRYGIKTHSIVVSDDAEEIAAALESFFTVSDVIITSGGAWTGDRDMVHKILGRLGWKFIFNRILMGPGKAVGFGLRENKPVFVLPGGPPSNLTGFLQIALPGLMKMAGYSNPGLPLRMVRLASDIKVRSIDWTQFIYGTLEARDGELIFHALENESRLQSMAFAQCVVGVPDNIDFYHAGTLVMAQIL
jgi:molybdopterin molybdotransferase